VDRLGGPIETDASTRFTAAPASLFAGKKQRKSLDSARTRAKISFSINRLPANSLGGKQGNNSPEQGIKSADQGNNRETWIRTAAT
jgi:hypothetical protein